MGGCRDYNYSKTVAPIYRENEQGPAARGGGGGAETSDYN